MGGGVCLCTMRSDEGSCELGSNIASSKERRAVLGREGRAFRRPVGGSGLGMIIMPLAPSSLTLKKSPRASASCPRGRILGVE